MMSGSPPTPKTRRTTLTLPADSLREAERIARKRNVTVSTVVGESLTAGLYVQTASERAEKVLKNYRKAFSGLSEEEMMILNGVILEPTRRKRKMIHPAWALSCSIPLSSRG